MITSVQHTPGCGQYQPYRVVFIMAMPPCAFIIVYRGGRVDITLLSDALCQKGGLSQF